MAAAPRAGYQTSPRPLPHSQGLRRPAGPVLAATAREAAPGPALTGGSRGHPSLRHGHHFVGDEGADHWGFPGGGAGPSQELRGKLAQSAAALQRSVTDLRPLPAVPGARDALHSPIERRLCPQPLPPPTSGAAPYLTGGLSSLRSATATERRGRGLARGTVRKRWS